MTRSATAGPSGDARLGRSTHKELEERAGKEQREKGGKWSALSASACRDGRDRAKMTRTGGEMRGRRVTTHFSDFSVSLLGPKMSIRRAASSEVRPFSSHLERERRGAERVSKREGKRDAETGGGFGAGARIGNDRAGLKRPPAPESKTRRAPLPPNMKEEGLTEGAA